MAAFAYKGMPLEEAKVELRRAHLALIRGRRASNAGKCVSVWRLQRTYDYWLVAVANIAFKDPPPAE